MIAIDCYRFARLSIDDSRPLPVRNVDEHTSRSDKRMVRKYDARRLGIDKSLYDDGHRRHFARQICIRRI